MLYCTIIQYSLERRKVWINKQICKFKLWWITNYYTDEQMSLKNLEIIKSLDSRLFINYLVSTACMFRLKVIFPNLEVYISKLKYINLFLEENRQIRNDWCRYDYKEITLEQFFINDEHNYCNPINTVQEFKVQYTKYCSLILLLESNVSDENQHSLRILTQYSSHLNAITLSLLQYTVD